MDIWEEKLVEQMKLGCNEAFERCYRLLSPQIYTVIFKVCRQQDTAQELLQDTFLDMYQKLNYYRREESFVAWIKRIAFNNTLNYLKKSAKLVLIEEQSTLEASVDSTSIEAIDNGELLDKLLTQLSEVERLVMWLFIVEQYTHDEIAVLVSKTPSFSKSIVSRALKKIRTSREEVRHAYI